jgi:small-conductance mechanosensitive channel
MDTKKIISWLLLLFGEILLIVAFSLFSGDLAGNILALNIVASSIIYGLFFVDILVPWIDFEDKSQRRAGSLGVRWLVTWLYAIAAVTVMVAGNIAYGATFSTQLIVHGVLVFLLLLGLLAALYASDKVSRVHDEEAANRSGAVELKKAMSALKDKVSETAGLPEDFISRVNTLAENLRFISPAESREARALEQSLAAAIGAIGAALPSYSLNAQQIENNLKKCEQLYQNRQHTYSN